MSEHDSQVPDALVPVDVKAVSLRSASLIKRGLALARSLQFPEGLRPPSGFMSRLIQRGQQLAAAREQFRQAVVARRQATAEAHFKRGLELWHQDDVGGAIAEYHAAIREQPDHVLANRNLIFALEAYDDPEGHFKLGIALLDRNDFDGAIAAFRNAVRLRPGHARPHYVLAMVLEAKGDHSAALDEWNKARELNPWIPATLRADSAKSS
jgi:tetratricopeptide (TPR) repeat protein